MVQELRSCLETRWSGSLTSTNASMLANKNEDISVGLNLNGLSLKILLGVLIGSDIGLIGTSAVYLAESAEEKKASWLLPVLRTILCKGPGRSSSPMLISRTVGSSVWLLRKRLTWMVSVHRNLKLRLCSKVYTHLTGLDYEEKRLHLCAENRAN
ncbi:hypothetical protein Tco_1220198 [Tanacetum coccineum]